MESRTCRDTPHREGGARASARARRRAQGARCARRAHTLHRPRRLRRASHGDGGDTSGEDASTRTETRNEDARTEPRRRLPSATSSASATRFSCASSTWSAPRRVTRPLPSRASPSAPPRERASRSSTGWPMPPRRSPRRARRRARRARVADLERTAPARAAALEASTRARVAEAVAEDRARGDARLRAAADAVAEAHHAKVPADARARATSPRRGAPRRSGSRGSRCRSAREGARRSRG